MSKMLLSINPEHVENIFRGNKQYEFRKVRCRANIRAIVIYATFPIMQVVGEAVVVNIIQDHPERVWALTSATSGITKQFFDKYFAGKSTAIAYELGEVKQYQQPLDLADFGITHAPQSFAYIS